MILSPLARKLLKIALTLTAVILLMSVMFAAVNIVNNQDEISKAQYEEIYKIARFCANADSVIKHAIARGRMSTQEYEMIKSRCKQSEAKETAPAAAHMQ